MQHEDPQKHMHRNLMSINDILKEMLDLLVSGEQECLDHANVKA